MMRHAYSRATSCIACWQTAELPDAGLKREWMIGQHLNRLRGPNGELSGVQNAAPAPLVKKKNFTAAPGYARICACLLDAKHCFGPDLLCSAGFMGTGAALIRKSDDGLEGLVLEKVNGMPLEKRCGTKLHLCTSCKDAPSCCKWAAHVGCVMTSRYGHEEPLLARWQVGISGYMHRTCWEAASEGQQGGALAQAHLRGTCWGTCWSSAG